MHHVFTLSGHSRQIGRIAWSPDGRLIASPSTDGTVRVWNADTGACERVIRPREADAPWTVAFSPAGDLLAVGHHGPYVTIWDPATGKRHDRLRNGPLTSVSFRHANAVAFAHSGLLFISNDYNLTIWDPARRKFHTKRRPNHDRANQAALTAHPVFNIVAMADGDGTLALMNSDGDVLGWVARDYPYAAAFHPISRLLAVENGSAIEVWSTDGRPLQRLEGHTNHVASLAFSPNGRLLASRSKDGTTRLWDTSTWGCVGVVSGISARPRELGLPGVAFAPSEPLLAVAEPAGPRAAEYVVRVYRLDPDVLLHGSTTTPVRYASAKIVLVGESGVGKTGLGWRLAHGYFTEHASTHGQQVWLLTELGTTRTDGVQCEAVLWDLAGQPDYRLIHALFLGDADLALLVIDPARDDDPLRAADYWLRQLRSGEPDAPTVILVPARVDRGGPRLTDEEIRAYCRLRGIETVVATSALTGLGLPALVDAMRAAVDWGNRPSTVTTETFKDIKDYVLRLKETGGEVPVILTPTELRQRLERDGVATGFTDTELTTAVGHLSKHGYVTWLRGSTGESSVLLKPELLNNLAASMVLEARRNPKGLGALEEGPLLAGEYRFPELDGLSTTERTLLLDSAVVMFLARNVCFRSADPLSNRTYLVFPELINLHRPTYADHAPVEEAIAYGVTGAVENLYASIVVILGYTNTFSRTDQWRNHARYTVGDGLECELRVETEGPGELTLVVSFGRDVPDRIRALFQGLVESLLDRRDLVVAGVPPQTT
ncbi:MAG: hypothetical protein IRY85_22140, partial [Micromonosporaceae bacterium]|nr:hypothetical protein [Micromonosporaceae bacterium]